MVSMQKYSAIFILAARHAIRNHKALIGLSVFLVTCLIIFANLWKIAASKAGVVHLDSDQLLWYIAFNEWVLVSIPQIQVDMEEDLRTGRLAYQLPRPISYLGATFCEALGTLCVNLTVLGAVTFLFTWLTVGNLPFAPIGLLAAVIFGLLAGCICILFHMLIGLTAFWLHDVEPFFWIWEKTLFMFGGLILPLTVYPQWMQTVAGYTPFPAILGARSALALDFSFDHCMALMLSLAAWGAIGLSGLLVVYHRGMRVLNIEGG